MYKSPIDLIYDRVVTEQENEVFKAVVRCGIDVDKDELIKALAYDRRQYDLGYADGKMVANAELIRCKDCVYFTPEKSGEHWNICRFYDAPKTADGYCNDAEPKDKKNETES